LSKSVRLENHQCSIPFIIPEASYTARTGELQRRLFRRLVIHQLTRIRTVFPAVFLGFFLLGDRFISIRWCRYFGVSFSLSLSLSCSKNLFIQIRGQSQPVPSRQISIFPTLLRRYIQGVASDVPIFSCLDRSSRKALFFFCKVSFGFAFCQPNWRFP